MYINVEKELKDLFLVSDKGYKIWSLTFSKVILGAYQLYNSTTITICFLMFKTNRER